MEPVEASESGDHLLTYGLPSSSKTPPLTNPLPTTIPNFNFIDPMTMAAVICEQSGGTSTTSNSSSSSSTSSATNFRCTDSITTSNSVSLAAAYAAASSNYSSSSSSSLNGNNKTNHLLSHQHIQNGNNHHHHHHHHHHQLHNGQHLYSPTNDYAGSSSVTSSNGYWPYSTQSYFPSAPRQYIVTQPPSSCPPITPTGVSDTSSLSSQQDLPYHTPTSYPHMQKMIGNYPVSYDFYQQHNIKYC